MTKIGEISPAGVASLKIYYNKKATRNPYSVRMEWKEPGPCGLRERKKTVVRYGDLYSCVCVLSAYAQAHNEERRP